MSRIAIIGAGPYGLSIAAHLRSAGVEPLVFGEAMSFWRSGMPVGMLLRSERPGSHIADPNCALTLDHFEAARRVELSRRIPLEDFVAYGLWFQQRAVPEIDSRRVFKISYISGQFWLTLSDGDTVSADRVVIATGLERYASRPAAFATVPTALAPHSSEIRYPAAFEGLEVAVIGAGQSALELAALLHEAGADVEVIARHSTIRFLSGRDLLRNSPVHRLVYPPGELGPPGINWIIELPELLRSLPASTQRWVALQVGPVGAAWLRPRLEKVRMTAGRSVVAAEPAEGRLRLVLNDGDERLVDRAVLATGYKVDIDKETILAPDLAKSLRRMNGVPELASGLESSVPGLHFAGAVAAANFGPLMRFVAGTGYAARAITRHVVPSRMAAPFRMRSQSSLSVRN